MKDKERTYYVCTKLNEDRETGPRLLILWCLQRFNYTIQLYHSITLFHIPRFGILFVQVVPGVFEKAPYNHYNDETNGKGRYDGYGL